MRIGIIALLQESNTFIQQPTTLAHFEQELLVTGESVRERLAGTHHEVAGMFHALDDLGEEAVPVFAARAVPFGVIDSMSCAAVSAPLYPLSAPSTPMRTCPPPWSPPPTRWSLIAPIRTSTSGPAASTQPGWSLIRSAARSGPRWPPPSRRCRSIS